jgi:hypothetical protein
MFMEKITRAGTDAVDVGEGEAEGFKPRRFERREVRCPVRVRIGNRQYAAYLDNASNGGVKLRTGCAIVPAERVIVQIPDLPPIKGELRWVSGREAGVAFPLVDGLAPLSEWLERRAPGTSSNDE